MRYQKPQIGDVITLAGCGLCRVVSITPQRKDKDLYHVNTLDGKYMIATNEDYIVRIDSVDQNLINCLDSIGAM